MIELLPNASPRRVHFRSEFSVRQSAIGRRPGRQSVSTTQRQIVVAPNHIGRYLIDSQFGQGRGLIGGGAKRAGVDEDCQNAHASPAEIAGAMDPVQFG